MYKKLYSFVLMWYNTKKIGGKINGFNNRCRRL
jgi:hypothetical protein